MLGKTLRAKEQFFSLYKENFFFCSSWTLRKKNTEFSRKKPVSGKTKRVEKGAKFCLEEFFLRIHLFFENNSFSVNLFWLWANTHRTFSETKCCIPRVEKKSFGKIAFCEGKNSFIKNFWLPLSFSWAMMRNKCRFFFTVL